MNGQRIRLCLVISNLELGGAERQVVEIANGLDPSRFETHVVTLGTPNPQAERLQPHVTYHALSGLEQVSAFQRIRRLQRRLHELKPHVVHAFLFDAEIASRIVHALRSDFRLLGSERNADYPISFRDRLLKRVTASQMDCCIANSYAGARYNRTLYGLPESRYRVVRNGVDVQRFRPADPEKIRATRRELDLPEDRPIVGMFASFKAQKNHIGLLNAAKILAETLPDVVYALVGDELEVGQRDTASYTAQLRSAVDSSPQRDQIRFLGKRDDVERVYPCCDLTVLPSLHEGLPNVVLESMACGVPVVATDVSDNKLLLETYDLGSIVALNDDAAFAKAMATWLTARAPIMETAIARVRQELSTAAMIENMTAVYQEFAFA